VFELVLWNVDAAPCALSKTSLPNRTFVHVESAMF
jgi:hypothetical protein